MENLGHEIGHFLYTAAQNNANIHGHIQSVQLYTTSAPTSVTKFGPETHIASPMNVVTQVFHYLSK